MLPGWSWVEKLDEFVNVLRLTLLSLACIMTLPQVGRAIAVLRCRDRGKSALHRARRRIAPGAGNTSVRS